MKSLDTKLFLRTFLLVANFFFTLRWEVSGEETHWMSSIRLFSLVGEPGGDRDFRVWRISWYAGLMHVITLHIMLLHYILCYYITYYVITLHIMLLHYILCYYITYYVITLHIMLLHYILCYYITYYVITLHIMLLHYILCYYITYYVITLHIMLLHYILCYYITYYVITLRIMLFKPKWFSNMRKYCSNQPWLKTLANIIIQHLKCGYSWYCHIVAGSAYFNVTNII